LLTSPGSAIRWARRCGNDASRISLAATARRACGASRSCCPKLYPSPNDEPIPAQRGVLDARIRQRRSGGGLADG
jgi:hypothetical protein